MLHHYLMSTTLGKVLLLKCFLSEPLPCTCTHTPWTELSPALDEKQTNKNGKSLLKSSGIGLFYIIALRNVNNAVATSIQVKNSVKSNNLMNPLPPIFNKNCLTLSSCKDNIKSKYRTRFHKSKSTPFSAYCGNDCGILTHAKHHVLHIATF